MIVAAAVLAVVLPLAMAHLGDYRCHATCPTITGQLPAGSAVTSGCNSSRANYVNEFGTIAQEVCVLCVTVSSAQLITYTNSCMYVEVVDSPTQWFVL